MMVFAVLGALLVIFIILTALVSFRASKRAVMVGTSPEEIAAEKAEVKARRKEQGKSLTWGW